MKYYLAVKNEVLILTWMNLQNIMLRERNESPRSTHFV